MWRFVQAVALCTSCLPLTAYYGCVESRIIEKQCHVTQEKAREVEVLREMRVNTMRDQIEELQRENQHLAEHICIAQELQNENNHMTQTMAVLQEHSTDLLRLLSSPWENMTRLRYVTGIYTSTFYISSVVYCTT